MGDNRPHVANVAVIYSGESICRSHREPRYSWQLHFHKTSPTVCFYYVQRKDASVLTQKRKETIEMNFNPHFGNVLAQISVRLYTLTNCET